MFSSPLQYPDTELPGEAKEYDPPKVGGRWPGVSQDVKVRVGAAATRCQKVPEKQKDKNRIDKMLLTF